MTAHHVLLCCSGSGESDEALRRVAALGQGGRVDVSVVLAVIDQPLARGCCGIQGNQWQRLMDEYSDDALRDVVRRLERLGCPPAHTAVAVGPSSADVVQRFATQWRCDVVAVAPKRWPWSTRGLPRRRLDALHRSVALPLVELRGGSDDVIARLAPSS
jgi:nucleotide-binding universal stress UspA family protein